MSSACIGFTFDVAVFNRVASADEHGHY